MNRLQRTCVALGRIPLSLIFVMSGIKKLMSWQDTADYMQQEGMVAVQALLVGAVIFELGGGLSLLFGWRPRWGAVALMIFIIPTTLIFHDFWKLEGAERESQMIHFMKNVAIFGGLLVALGASSVQSRTDQRATRD